MSIFWLILTGIFLFLEILTVGFFIFWLAVGAFCAFIAASLGLTVYLQVFIFTMVSIILIVFMRPILKKFVKINNNPTNTDAIISKEATVIKKIGPNETIVGQVRLGGEVWSAATLQDTAIEVGQIVKIDKIDGVKLIVSSK